MRFRITAVTSALLLAILAVTGLLLVLVQGSLLVDGVNEAIEQRADDIESLLDSDGARTIGTGAEETAVQVVRNGTIVETIGPFQPAVPFGVAPPPGRTQIISTVRNPVGIDGDFQLLSRRIGAGDGSVVIHVLGDLSDVNEARNVLFGALAIALPAAAALSALLIWTMVGRTLEPVENMRAEVADITGAELDRRVPEPGTNDEIDRLATTMNAMLSRIEGAALQQRRFIDDASHELRTPLTRLRSSLEISQAHPDTVDLDVAFDELLEETVGLQRLVEDLLYLARADANPAAIAASERASMEPVDLDDVVIDEVSRVRPEISTDISTVESARVWSRRGQVLRAVRNVIENAGRHAESVVAVRLSIEGRNAVLIVSDDGPGVSPEARELVFDRFSRLDEARTGESGRSGLGLAITKEIVERHGGTISFVDPASSIGAEVHIRLPIAE